MKEGKEDLKDQRDKAREKWKTLPEEKKEKYEEMSGKNKEFYEKLRKYLSGPLSGYILFARDRMEKARENKETLSLKEVAVLWKKAKEGEKAKFEEYSKVLKKEIEDNRDLMDLAFNLKPKRSKTAFQLFIKDQYAKGEAKGFGKFKALSEKWENLDDKEKDKFIRLAQKYKLIYIVKKNNYDAFLKKERGKPLSSYNIFMQDNAGEPLKVIYKKWKNSDKETKERYLKKAKVEREKFELKREEFKCRVYDKPKKSPNPFCFFVRQCYFDLVDSNMKPKEKRDKLLENWKNLNDKQKKKYEELSEESLIQRKEYLKEYETKGYYTQKLINNRKRLSQGKKPNHNEGNGQKDEVRKKKKEK